MGGLRANRARRAPGVLTVGWAGCRSSVPVSFRSIRIRIPVPRSRIHTTPRCSAASSTTPRCRTISPIQASTASPSRHRTTRPPSGEGVMGSAAEARVRRDRPPSSSGTTGSTGPLPEGPENGAGTDMTGTSFNQQTGELISTDHHDQRTSGDTSPQPACCRSHGGGRGRLHAAMRDRTEATATPVSCGMTPRDGATTAHSSHNHPLRQTPRGRRQDPFYLIVSMLATMVAARSTPTLAPKCPRPALPHSLPFGGRHALASVG